MGHLAAHLTLATSRDAAPLRPRPGKGAANYQNYHLLPGRGVASSLRMGAAPLTCPAREMDPFFFLSFLSFPPFRTFASVSNFSCLENGRSKKNKRECVLSTNTLSLSIVWKYWGRIPAREFAWRSVSQARDIVFHSIAFSYANYTSRDSPFSSSSSLPYPLPRFILRRVTGGTMRNASRPGEQDSSPPCSIPRLPKLYQNFEI